VTARANTPLIVPYLAGLASRTLLNMLIKTFASMREEITVDWKKLYTGELHGF
jgi:hypothetical protein